MSLRTPGCALGSRGQRIASVARRPVVVVSISSDIALDTRHLLMKYVAVASYRGSAGSRMLRRLDSKFNVSFLSEVCPDMGA